MRLGIYRHHKGGRYKVEEMAKYGSKFSEQEFVVYRALDGELAGQVFVRELESFNENSKFIFENE